MKKLNLSILTSAFLMIGFSSCVKQMDLPPSANSTSVEKYADINASESFNWSTTRKVNFSFNGSSSQEYQLVLKVVDANGNILMQKLQKANETYKVVLDVPVHYESITVIYGSDMEKFDCKSGSVSMNID